MDFLGAALGISTCIPTLTLYGDGFQVQVKQQQPDRHKYTI